MPVNSAASWLMLRTGGCYLISTTLVEGDCGYVTTRRSGSLPAQSLTCSRGVASVALRSLAHAGECLVNRAEQEEVITIVNKIHKETGWRIQFVIDELIKKWGWNEQQQQQQQPQMPNIMAQHPNSGQGFGFQAGASVTSLPPAPPIKTQPPTGIVNPMLARADFAQPMHPYQNYYVAPNLPAAHNQFNHY